MKLLTTAFVVVLCWAGDVFAQGCRSYQAGTGCAGVRQSYGCRGAQQTYGCQGARESYGCRGAGGCFGATGGQMGFPAGVTYADPPVRYERYEKYEGPPPVRGYSAPPRAYYAPPAAAVAIVPYGTRMPDGRHATKTGDPPPPGLFPGRGPLRDAWRRAKGYDVGPW